MSAIEGNLPLWASNPWSLLIFQTSLIVGVVGFTPASSRVRWLLIPLQFYLTWSFVFLARKRINNTFHASFGASDAWLTALQYADVAFLSKWDFAYGGPKPKAVEKKTLVPFGKDTFLNRLTFGIYAASSYRCSGTPFEVANLAPFDRKDPQYQPSTTKYLLGAIKRTVICYLLLDAMVSFGDPEAMAPLFADDRIPLLRRLPTFTVEEAVTRFITSFSFWLVNYLTLMLFFDIPGIICVSLGLSDVSWWRPPFNSILEGYTLRRYWGKFWHQSVRKRINHPATYITYSVLGLPSRSIIARYTALILTFTMSTFQHATGDVASGIPWWRTGSPSFFMSQAAGFIAEDLFQHFWGRLGGKSNLMTRIFGYLWVFLWMFWTTPFYSYPVSGANKGDPIIPFSVLKPLAFKFGLIA
ncbi:hypothetical protein NHQ30_008472 [Ciborinia camelliae]|nr:hypothetical protein NHQ30_008472 [Ciborinia camelliae]